VRTSIPFRQCWRIASTASVATPKRESQALFLKSGLGITSSKPTARKNCLQGWSVRAVRAGQVYRKQEMRRRTKRRERASRGHYLRGDRDGGRGKEKEQAYACSFSIAPALGRASRRTPPAGRTGGELLS
jgi:hypothetical protein